MAGALKDDFKPGAPITQVPVVWFNRVAKMLNGLVGGLGMFINKDGTDTAAVEVSLNVETARKSLGVPNIAPNAEKRTGGQGDTLAQIAAKYAPAPTQSEPENETTAQKVARIGTSEQCARADHVHNLETIIDEPAAVDWSEAFENVDNGGGYWSLKFYPPIFDKAGRFTGEFSATGVTIIPSYYA